MLITEEHITEAFDQVDTFARVHYQEPENSRLEAFEAYQEFLGMTEKASEVLTERIVGFAPNRTEAARWLYIGVVLGLSAAAKATEPY
jgi:hypothetical protein